MSDSSHAFHFIITLLLGNSGYNDLTTMKAIFRIFLLLCGVIGLASCSSSDSGGVDEPENNGTAKFYLSYTLSTNGGQSMSRAAKMTRASNADVFNEFYTEMQSGALMAPSYTLTFKNNGSNVTYTETGKWSEHEMVTLPTGTYHVTGYSKADGENIQDKCSILFEEDVVIDANTTVVQLHAKYDCSLLVFKGADIASLKNYNGSESKNFFSFNSYKYAFVNNILYKSDSKSDAYIEGQYTDGKSFRVTTGDLIFEKGKYYIYDQITNSFVLPPMEGGNAESNSGLTTLVLDANSQPPLVGAVISNYTPNIVKKGFIISTSDDNLTIDDKTTYYTEYYYSDENFNDDPKDFRVIDCSKDNEEQFNIYLHVLKANTQYYVRSYIITSDGSITYGNIVTVQSQNYNRYGGYAGYGNVWHAFDYTLFDLMTDEIIDPDKDGFYYSTNENPTNCSYQIGTSYNTCYKFKTQWNYYLWYYHNAFHTNADDFVEKPVAKYADGKVTLRKNNADSDKNITIYYQVNGDGMRPENFEHTYSTPISVKKGDIVYCYAKSNKGYISYTNVYKVY